MHAQPGPLEHMLLDGMHELPQALLIEQTLQQLGCGDGPGGDGIPDPPQFAAPITTAITKKHAHMHRMNGRYTGRRS